MAQIRLPIETGLRSIAIWHSRICSARTELIGGASAFLGGALLLGRADEEATRRTHAEQAGACAG